MQSPFYRHSLSLLMILSSAFAQEDQPIGQAHIKLLECDGSKASVQLIITPAPHWHAYWINPGDAGASPSLKTSQGEVKMNQASIPERFSHKGLITYGYEKGASFIYHINKVDAAENLTVKANYLLCNSARCTANNTEQTFTLSSFAKEEAEASPTFHYPTTSHEIKSVKVSKSKEGLTYFWKSPQEDLSGWQVFPETESLRESEGGSLVTKVDALYTFTVALQGERPQAARFLLRKNASCAVLIEATP